MLGGLCFIHATRQLPLGRQGPSRVRVEGQRWVPADCCRVQSIPSMKEANRKEIRCPCCNKLIGKVQGREFSLETVCPRCNNQVLFEATWASASVAILSLFQYKMSLKEEA